MISQHSKAAERCGGRYDTARYWKRWVSGEFGFRGLPGRRESQSFSQSKHFLIQIHIYWLLKRVDPRLTLQEIQTNLNKRFNISVSKEFIRRIFVQWEWSWKRAAYIQKHKFTPENVRYYRAWLLFILRSDLNHIKFLDEVHFEKNDVRRKYIVSPIGEPVFLIDDERLDVRWSVTCLVGLDEESPCISFRSESNTQEDFFNFVAQAIKVGYLKRGDVLVMDNASVHTGSDMLPDLQKMADMFDIDLRYLPTYSPELNPVELVFANVKNWLRSHRDTSVPLTTDIARAFARIDQTKLSKYYIRCCRTFEFRKSK
eukprot:TRINITY_DN1445_c0_g1_i2.p1 TRINITY_DN1445_c0_g1~~TRINITY_DN1445_c0_g1_i2.p1  ORF type:complete len:314 (-),score=86.19 TRINITY_DN1445_c0_g1_i2:79-1020(-)